MGDELKDERFKRKETYHRRSISTGDRKLAEFVSHRFWLAEEHGIRDVDTNTEPEKERLSPVQSHQPTCTTGF